MDPLLTVIIPAYNVEDYVCDALRSALEATRDGSLRVLVVNDDSQDGPLAKVQEIQRRHDALDAVTVVDQPNGGVAAARNAGLEAVATPFVGFLDADDMFTPAFGSAVVPELVRLSGTDVDVIEFNSLCFDESGRSAGAIRTVEPHARGTDSLDAHALEQTAHRFNNYLWCRIFRTSLFDGVRFPECRDYVDVAVVPALYARARRVRRLDVDGVIRRYRAGSIMRTPSLTKARDWLLCHRGCAACSAPGRQRRGHEPLLVHHRRKMLPGSGRHCRCTASRQMARGPSDRDGRGGALPGRDGPAARCGGFRVRGCAATRARPTAPTDPPVRT